MNKSNFINIILKKIWFYLKKLLKYPFDVRKKFDYYNYIIYLIYTKTNDSTALKLRKRNHLLINVLIFLPMFLGVLYSGISLINNKNRYIVYYQRILLPLEGETPIRKTLAGFKRTYYAVRYHPLQSSDFEAILHGYLFAILGAGLMSKHPAFKKQKDIEDVLLNSNRVDEDGKPWSVVWTPKALYFEAYQCDVYKFVNETKFWNTINYSPAEPLLIPDDKRKFIIREKFELPPKIIFKSNEV